MTANETANERTLDTLSNNKLLVAVLTFLITWIGFTTIRIGNVETKQAVQQEQIATVQETVKSVKGDTDKILWLMLPADQRPLKPVK